MSTNRPGILVVEDEHIVAADLEHGLLHLGYDVVGIADSGQDAVRLAGQTRPELVLMDIKLRGPMDGITAAREIREQWQIPIIFLTGNTNEDTFGRAEAVGPFGYLSKPFRVKDLSATVALALQQNRVTRGLFAEKTWLRTMLASFSDGVLATDEQGFVRYMSPVAEAMTGWSHEEALGKPIEDVYRLLSVDGLPISQCQLRKALETRHSIPRAEFLMLSKSGKQFFVEDAAAPIFDENERLIGAVTLFLDITERHQAEQQRESLRAELERSNEDLARFSYSLSHDLQAPIRTVRTFAELLARGKNGDLTEHQLRLLDMITQAADGMQRLVESMLAFAQVGEGEIKREAVSIEDLIKQVRINLAPLIEETRTTIRCGPLPEIEGDPVQIERLFENLISNALKYRQPGVPPVISISGESLNTGWAFAVQDNGQGVPKESQQRIFEPLKRLHGSEVPGSGLGLTLCRKIIERHGGEIWVESAGAGHGATFRFLLSKADRE